jgi:hypothetical protein
MVVMSVRCDMLVKHIRHEHIRHDGKELDRDGRMVIS